MSRRFLPRSGLAAFFTLALLSSTAGTACNKPEQPLPHAAIEKNYDRPLPPGQFALRKIDPSQYPDFGAGWYRAKRIAMREAIQNSIAYLNAPSSKKYYPMGPITHEKALASLHAFYDVLDQANSPEALNEIIRDNFDVYMSVGCDDEGTVLFTGYYSPIFNGSRKQTDEFRYPLYKMPPDVQKDEEGNVIGGPWRTREEIESQGILAGQELIWLGDRFETYVVTVQGSGFIRLPDGTLHEIGYAGNNGHEYTPIGRMLVADGKIDRNRLSLDSMIRHFRQYPQDLDHYLFQNKRYIFFKDAQGGPFGCLGKPVTPEYSIATDKDIFPRACLAFVDTYAPAEQSSDMQRFRTFALDHDRGAAIRAPGRCDLYMGVGDRAGQRAGYTYSEGRLYYLFLKDGIQTITPRPIETTAAGIDTGDSGVGTDQGGYGD